MRSSYSNQAAEAILRVQGEPVLINGVTTTAVVVRHVRSDRFGEERYHMSPDMVSVKVSSSPDVFTDAIVILDGKNYLVSETSQSGFGLVNLLCRLQ